MKYLKTSLIVAVLFSIFFSMSSSGVPAPGDTYPLSVNLTLGYLKLDGIDGEAVEKDHNKWCDIIAVTTGVFSEHANTGGSRRRSGVLFENIAIMKELDKASPKILEACAKGTIIPKVEIDITGGTGGGFINTPSKSSSQGMSSRLQDLNDAFQGSGSSTGDFKSPYLKWELLKARITSHVIDNTNNRQGALLESFTIEFEEIKMTYTEFDNMGKSKGNIEFNWKVETGE